MSEVQERLAAWIAMLDRRMERIAASPTGMEVLRTARPLIRELQAENARLRAELDDRHPETEVLFTTERGMEMTFSAAAGKPDGTVIRSTETGEEWVKRGPVWRRAKDGLVWRGSRQASAQVVMPLAQIAEQANVAGPMTADSRERLAQAMHDRGWEKTYDADGTEIWEPVQLEGPGHVSITLDISPADTGPAGNLQSQPRWDWPEDHMRIGDQADDSCPPA